MAASGPPADGGAGADGAASEGRRETGRRPLAAAAVGILAALAAAGVAAAAAATSGSGRGVLAAVVLAGQVVLGGGWLAVLGATAGCYAIVGAASLACDGVLLREHTDTVGALAPVLGLALIAVLGYQLGRRAPRPRMTADAAAALSGLVIVAFLAGWIALRAQDTGRDLVVAALVAAGAGTAAARLPALRPAGPLGALARVGGLAVAAGAAALYGGGAAALSAPVALAVGAAAGFAALVADLAAARGFAERPASTRFAVPVAALLPLAVAAPAAYLTGTALVG